MEKAKEKNRPANKTEIGEYVGSFGRDITGLFPVVMTEFCESHLKHSHPTDWQLFAESLATFSCWLAILSAKTSSHILHIGI